MASRSRSRRRSFRDFPVLPAALLALALGADTRVIPGDCCNTTDIGPGAEIQPGLRHSTLREPDVRTRRSGRDVESAPGESAFWHWRVAYPTGRFEPRWYDRALAQHARVAKGLP